MSATVAAVIIGGMRHTSIVALSREDIVARLAENLAARIAANVAKVAKDLAHARAFVTTARTTIHEDADGIVFAGAHTKAVEIVFALLDDAYPGCVWLLDRGEISHPKNTVPEIMSLPTTTSGPEIVFDVGRAMAAERVVAGDSYVAPSRSGDAPAPAPAPAAAPPPSGGMFFTGSGGAPPGFSSGFPPGERGAPLFGATFTFSAHADGAFAPAATPAPPAAAKGAGGGTFASRPAPTQGAQHGGFATRPAAPMQGAQHGGFGPRPPPPGEKRSGSFDVNAAAAAAHTPPPEPRPDMAETVGRLFGIAHQAVQNASGTRSPAAPAAAASAAPAAPASAAPAAPAPEEPKDAVLVFQTMFQSVPGFAAREAEMRTALEAAMDAYIANSPTGLRPSDPVARVWHDAAAAARSTSPVVPDAGGPSSAPSAED